MYFKVVKNLNIVDNNFMSIALLAIHVHNRLVQKVLFQRNKKVIVFHVMKKLLRQNARAVLRYSIYLLFDRFR
jgi:hypothetical protein